ncbi:MAG: molecular chaperone TorD family protein [Planctomycetota bacterium]
MRQDELAAVARLLGLLLLREIDGATLEQLRHPAVLKALESAGLEPPTDGALEELAAQYFEYFVNPQLGRPLVQSICESGSYEGDAARGVREVAAAANLELDNEHLRGAPVDHLAVQLFLWSELQERDQEAAQEFGRRHLQWAIPVLQHDKRSGYYANVCAATADFLQVVMHESGS